MFSSSFTMSEQEHRQSTPYKQTAPDTVVPSKPQNFVARQGDAVREGRHLNDLPLL
jgi:hypothetical protein